MLSLFGPRNTQRPDGAEEPVQERTVPEARIAEIEAALQAIAEGSFDAVPEGTDRLGRAVRSLAEKLQGRARDELETTVGLSMALVDQVVGAAGMMRAARDVSDRSQTIAAAAEEMVASVSEIASSGDAAAAEMAQANETSIRGARVAADAVAAMERIAGAVNDSARKVNILSEASAQIGAIVAQIEAIAEQTKLLALNATIEAARAGEAGKGFAVVASEVKNLAAQTGSATEDIRNRIEKLRQEMAEIVTSMGHAAEVVQGGEKTVHQVGIEMHGIAERSSAVDARIQEIARILEEQQEASSEVSRGIVQIVDGNKAIVEEVGKLLDHVDATEKIVTGDLARTMKADIPLKTVLIAKSDHMIWRKRLAAMLVGRESLRSGELADHHSCRLGKWYDSIKDDAICKHPAFIALEAPHRDVHAYGIAAARCWEKNDLEGALREIAAVEKSSREVLRYLDELAAR